MDLALNNLQKLTCHKIQPTNHPTNQLAHSTASESILLGLPDFDYCSSCNPSEISSTIWYSTVISCTFTFHLKNVFGCFCSIMAWFKLIKHN